MSEAVVQAGPEMEKEERGPRPNCDLRSIDRRA